MDALRPLLDAVYARPEDDGARAVYADALLEAGNPMGEFIQLQLARARGKRGTGAKERRLFDPTWWRDHPVAAVQGVVRYEQTDRGFPDLFSPALSVGDEARRTQIRSWERLVGHAGWSTLRRMRAHVDEPTIGRILAGTPMPLLTEVEGIGTAVLAELARRPRVQLAATRLWITRRPLPDGSAALPSLASFPQLRSLWWNSWMPRPRAGLAEAVAQVEAMGVLARLEVLELGGFEVASMVREPIEWMGRLPSTLAVLKVHGGISEIATVTRTGATVALALDLTAQLVEPAATALAALPAVLLSSLRIRFIKGGYFRQSELPGMIAVLRLATRHLPQCELPTRVVAG